MQFTFIKEIGMSVFKWHTFKDKSRCASTVVISQGPNGAMNIFLFLASLPPLHSSGGFIVTLVNENQVIVINFKDQQLELWYFLQFHCFLTPFIPSQESGSFSCAYQQTPVHFTYRHTIKIGILWWCAHFLSGLGISITYFTHQI